MEKQKLPKLRGISPTAHVQHQHAIQNQDKKPRNKVRNETKDQGIFFDIYVHIVVQLPTATINPTHPRKELFVDVFCVRVVVRKTGKVLEVLGA